jgi:toxin ParE1/3/4
VRRHRVVFRRSAQDDLRAIYNYIRQETGSGETGKAYLRRIRKRCQKIADAPFGGVSRDDLGDGIRMTVFERRIVILYRVEDNAVWVTNIFSGGRDYDTLLKRRGNLPPEETA